MVSNCVQTVSIYFLSNDSWIFFVNKSDVYKFNRMDVKAEMSRHVLDKGSMVVVKIGILYNITDSK